jgi:hypothetical protein
MARRLNSSGNVVFEQSPLVQLMIRRIHWKRMRMMQSEELISNALNNRSITICNYDDFRNANSR